MSQIIGKGYSLILHDTSNQKFHFSSLIILCSEPSWKQTKVLIIPRYLILAFKATGKGHQPPWEDWYVREPALPSQHDDDGDVEDVEEEDDDEHDEEDK